MFRKKTGIALAALLFFCAGITGFVTNGFGLFDEPETMQTAQQNDGGAILGNGSGNGLRLMSTVIAKADYAANGVSPLAETAYTLTATVYPENASNKALDWSVSFVNASSSWATGKTVTDYVTVTPTSDGALTATVENLQAFGEQIQVKATSRDNPDAYATCTVDYLQRTMGYKFVLVGEQGYPVFQIGFSTENGNEATVKPDFSKTNIVRPQLSAVKNPIYTRKNTDEATYYTLKPTAEFKSAVGEDAGLFEASGSLADGNYCLPIDFFGLSFNIYENDPEKMNNFIDVIDTYDAGAFYEITLYDEEGGVQLAKFNIMLDASIIKDQKGVETVSVDEMEIVF